MNITIENYEAYLLDLWEGNLSPEEEAMLNDFLAQHPELDSDDALTLQDDISVTQPTAEFDKSTISYDSVNEHNAMYFFIAYHEGDLTKKERKEVLQFVKSNPSHSKQFNQFEKARMPKEQVLYPHKKELLAGKVEGRVISIASRNWMIGIAAASIAAFFWFIGPTSNGIDARYAMEEMNTTIDRYENSSLAFNIRGTQTNESLNKESFNASDHSNSYNNTTLNGEQKQSTSPDPNRIKDNLDPIEKSSIANVKANGLNNVMASINTQDNNSENTVAEKDQNQADPNQEDIPTILELTASYLQRKKVLNNDRKPNLKNILNNTLASVNEDKPVLATNEGSDSKRTVFQLGDFKFERISKK